MKSQRNLLLLAVMLAMLAIPAFCYGAEITGRVTAVGNGVATVSVTSDPMPNVGDPVRIVEVFEGVGEVDVTTGRVTEVGDGTIKVKIGPGGGTVTTHQVARISSDDGRLPETDDPIDEPATDAALAKKHNTRGCSLMAAKKYSEAADAVREAIRADPTNSTYHANFIIALGVQKLYAEAVQAGEAGVRVAPESARVRFQFANALYGMKKYEESENEYRTAVKLAPEKSNYHAQLAGALYQLGKNQEAIESARKAKALGCNKYWVYEKVAKLINLEGVALDAEKELAKTEAAYREAIRFDPKRGVYHNNLAFSLLRQKRYVEAEKSSRQAVAMSPEQPRYHDDLGASLYSQRRYAEAEAAYRAATEIDPEYSKSFANTAGALVMQGKRDEAFEPARKAISLGMKEHWVFAKLGLDPSKKGGGSGVDKREPTATPKESFKGGDNSGPDTGPSREDFSDADDPATSGPGRKGSDRVHRTPIFHLSDTDDPSYPMIRAVDPYAELRGRGPSPREKTLEDYRAEVRENPDSGLAHYELGNVLWAKGETREAEAAYRKAVQCWPNVGQFHHVVGFTHGQRGQWKEAEACFRKARALYVGWEDRDPYFLASLAEALYRQGRYKEAERSAQIALDHGERSHSIYKTLNMYMPPLEERLDSESGETPGQAYVPEPGAPR